MGEACFFFFVFGAIFSDFSARTLPDTSVVWAYLSAAFFVFGPIVFVAFEPLLCGYIQEVCWFDFSCLRIYSQ